MSVGFLLSQHRRRSAIISLCALLEGPMIDVVEALILDLLEWVSKGEHTYEEVMDAWRTSCPKLPVWEDANERGLITEEY